MENYDFVFSLAFPYSPFSGQHQSLLHFKIHNSRDGFAKNQVREEK